MGSNSANQIDIESNGVINVTCNNETLYNIGLSPSNGNESGAGVMTEASGDGDGVLYQLHSTSDDGGAISLPLRM